MAQLLNEELAESVMQSITHLAFYRKSNAQKKTYYDGKNCLSNLSIFLDDRLGNLGIALPWAKLAVTALHDRMELDAVVTSSDEDNEIIREILEENYFFAKIREAIHEGMLYGCSYLLAGFGSNPLEPSVKVTVESPNTTFGEYDAGSRTLKSLLKIKVDKDEQGREMLTAGELYLPEAIVYFKVKEAKKFEIESIRKGYGFIPAVKLINTEDGSLGEGASEINHIVRSLIDFALGQFGNMRVASDAFAQPTQYIVGIGGDKTQNKAGEPTKLSRKAGAVWTAPFARDANGDVTGTPEIGQLDAGTPDTYIKIAESLVKQLALATRIPDSQLGFSKSMPSSAEAIKSEETSFVRRIEKKTRIFAEPIEKIVRIAYLMKTGRKLTGSVIVKWVEPGTVTLASNTDAVVKAIGAGIVSATSDWVYDKLGVSYAERQKMRAEMSTGKNSLLFQTMIDKADKLSASNAALEVPSGEELALEGEVIE